MVPRQQFDRQLHREAILLSSQRLVISLSWFSVPVIHLKNKIPRKGFFSEQAEFPFPNTRKAWNIEAPNRIPFDLVRWADNVISNWGPPHKKNPPRTRRGINHYGNLFVQYVSFLFSPDGGQRKGTPNIPYEQMLRWLSLWNWSKGTSDRSWTFILIKDRLQWLWKRLSMARLAFRQSKLDNNQKRAITTIADVVIAIAAES